MQTRQGTVLQSLQDVQQFLDRYADKLGDIPASGARASLDQLVTELSSHAADQTGGTLQAQGATQQYRALRTVLLRDHMAPIARIARAELPNSPAVQPLRNMPRGRPTAQRLATLADGMAQAAVPYTDVFVRAGRPADFGKRLADAADAMLGALGDRNESRARRRGATMGIRTQLSRGRKIVGVIDAFVQSALASDPVLLAHWNLVKRVRKTTGGPPAEPSSPPVVTPAPAPASASTGTSVPAAAPAPVPQPAA